MSKEFIELIIKVMIIPFIIYTYKIFKEKNKIQLLSDGLMIIDVPERVLVLPSFIIIAIINQKTNYKYFNTIIILEVFILLSVLWIYYSWSLISLKIKKNITDYIFTPQNFNEIDILKIIIPTIFMFINIINYIYLIYYIYSEYNICLKLILSLLFIFIVIIIFIDFISMNIFFFSLHQIIKLENIIIDSTYYPSAYILAKKNNTLLLYMYKESNNNDINEDNFNKNNITIKRNIKTTLNTKNRKGFFITETENIKSTTETIEMELPNNNKINNTINPNQGFLIECKYDDIKLTSK